MRRIIGFAIGVLALAAMFAFPASAHVQVNDHGHGSGWVGSPAEGIPGKGKALVPGGPTGQTTLSPAHVKGLNTACEALKAHGNAAVQIFGPPSPAGCSHGT